jgi:hypothetical protein
VHLLKPGPIRLTANFLPLDFYLVRFWAFLGKGSSKTPHKYFFPKKIDNNSDVSFLVYFILLRFRVFLGDGSSKTVQNKCKKTIVSKSFLQKNRPKSEANPIPSRFFKSCFWAFLGEGSSKTQ